MKKLLVLIIFTLLSVISYAQTQTEMNIQAAKSYDKADKELNRVYQQILKKYAKNTLFIKHLKAAQQLWVQFRDAEFKRAFPHFEEGNTYYGTMFSGERSAFKEDLTIQRTKTLKVILKDGPR
jgi:uncharacterized protein YecT (DUF1311 family)